MDNQLTVINPKKLDISKSNQFAAFVKQAQMLAGVLEEAWDVVEQQMLDRNVKLVRGDWGTISVAKRTNWKATSQLPPRYYKRVLDTSKLNSLSEAGKKLPAGVGYTTSQYITKRLK